MIALIQRVRRAEVRVGDRVTGAIEAGLRVRIAPELIIRASAAPPGR